MSTEPEWGPWVEHDGKGCPVRGQMVQSVERCGLVEIHVAGSINPHLRDVRSCWLWGSVQPKHEIIRYRVRKPRGMVILEGILADIPQPVGEPA